MTEVSATTNLSPSEQLMYSTVRIDCSLADGSSSTGTGFFFGFLQEGDHHVPAIVTNRHVVEGSTTGRFLLHVKGKNEQPSGEPSIAVQVDGFGEAWIGHPDPEVDLCVFPTAPLITAIQREKGKTPFFLELDPSLIPNEEELQSLTALEDVIMVGYPSGLWDSINNTPIMRRGITATHPAKDYEGRPEFMIDAACFPGSSGSPVLLFNVGGYASKDGGTVIGSRVKLLGVLYAGPQFTATGEIQIVSVPTQQKAIASSAIPMNLGMVIRSERLLEFEDKLRRLAARPGT